MTFSLNHTPSKEIIHRRQQERKGKIRAAAWRKRKKRERARTESYADSVTPCVHGTVSPQSPSIEHQSIATYSVEQHREWSDYVESGHSTVGDANPCAQSTVFSTEPESHEVTTCDVTPTADREWSDYLNSGRALPPVSSARFSPNSTTRLDTPLTRDDSRQSSIPDALLKADGSVMSLRQARERYKQHIAGERANGEYGNTFESRARKWYAKALDADRYFRDEFDDCHIGHFALSGQPKDDEGNWIAPLDFIDSLCASLDSVTRALRRTFDDRRYGWYAVLAATEECTLPHWHFMVYTEGELTDEELQRAQSKHPKHSTVALEANHTVETVDIDRADELELEAIGEMDRERGLVSPIARYVMGQLANLPDNLRESYGMEHGALMWAYAGQSFRHGGEFSEAAASGVEHTTESETVESSASTDDSVTPCVESTVSGDDNSDNSEPVEPAEEPASSDSTGDDIPKFSFEK